MKPLSSIPLSGLQAAEVVARTGSLSAAAHELGITIGAVSQRIAKLEAVLGQALFERHVSGMIPTQTGAAMAGFLTAGFQQIQAGVAEATRDRRHSLIVSVAPIFASRWLVRRLAQFSKLHPDIAVRIEASVGLVDPNTTDVDLCLRVGEGPYPDVRAEKLMAQRIMPVCAPQVAERLSSPADLADVPIIYDVNAVFSWDTWLKAEGLSSDILKSGPEFSDGSLCFDAAMGGAGVFLAWETLDTEALRDGRIVAPFERRQPTGQYYWLVCAKDRAPSAAQSYFTRWLKAELAADGIALE